MNVRVILTRGPNEGLQCVNVHHAPYSKALSGHRSCYSDPLIRRHLIPFIKGGDQITECPVGALCDGYTWVAFVPLALGVQHR